jgi:hypothetical protein
MQTSLELFGTAAGDPLQLLAVFQSVVPAPPVQLTVHDSAAPAGALAGKSTPAPNAVTVAATMTRLPSTPPRRPTTDRRFLVGR